MLYLQNLKQRVERPPEDMGIPVKWALAVLFLVIIGMAFMAMTRK